MSMIGVEETINPNSTNDSNLVNGTPATPSRDSLLMRNFRCILTQEIFEDPTIAPDGQTYEQLAIIEWLKKYPCSPITGAPMKAIFQDNG